MAYALNTQTPPGPRGCPFIGVTLQLKKAFLSFFSKMAAEYGDISYFKVGSQERYLINHPDYIQQVLTDHRKYPKGLDYEFLKPVIGSGLITNNGNFWKKQRKLINPIFHKKILQTFVEDIQLLVTEHIESWTLEKNQAKKIDMTTEMMSLTLKILVRTMFGNVISKASYKNIAEAIYFILGYTKNRIWSPFRLSEKIPFPKHIQFKKHLDFLDSLIFQLIEERKNSHQQEYNDLLAMLLNAVDDDSGKKMSKQQLRDEMMTFFLAGHETTSNLLCWTFYLLARHPEIEQKLCKKLNTPARASSPGKGKQDSDYLDLVLHESMRLYPPVWSISRSPIEDVEIGAYKIPRNSIVMLSQWVTHRSPRYWQQPEEFIPERFQEKQVAQRHPYVYFPFGGGARICIGNNFSLMESRIILSMILKQFKFKLIEQDVQPEAKITLRPKNGLKMTVVPRI